jgi:peptide/nickel transport system substrate-binding protein
MQRARFAMTLASFLTLVVSACAPQAGSGGSSSPQPSQPAQPKKLTAALLKPNLVDIRDQQANRITNFIVGGLLRIDPLNQPQAELAEQVPSAENGLWVVRSDGTMEMKFTIRPNATWHDGRPITTDDVLFHYAVSNDTRIALGVIVHWRDVETIEALDQRTFLVKFRRPNIQGLLLPGVYPKHLLEEPYRASPETWHELRAWSSELIGAGPYRVREWNHSSFILMDAFDGYVLGRPKIDTVEIKLIGDSAAMTANVLSGAIDLTLGLAISPDEALDVKSRWTDGSVIAHPYQGSTVGLVIQHLNPDPPIIGQSVEFRQAIIHAVDRQLLVDTIMAGMSKISHSYVQVPWLDQVDNMLVKYEYDPRKAVQMLEQLGYTRGPGGALQDRSGATLTVGMRVVQEESDRLKAATTVSDFWQQIGMRVNLDVVPSQGSTPEYMATAPSFSVRGITGGDESLISRMHVSAAPLPENRFRGNNLGRYINEEKDALIDRFFQTVPLNERTAIGGRIFQHWTANAVAHGLYYNVDLSMVHNRLKDVVVSSHHARAYDNHLWDIR